MSKEIQGNLVNLWLREPGDADFQVLVCTEDLQMQITTEVSKRRTNCGVKTSVADVDFNFSGNAVQNADPTATEVSHTQMKTWIVAKQKLEFRYYNNVHAGNDIAEGEGVNSYGNLYITDLTSTSSAEADGMLSFSFTGEGTGTLDQYDDNS